MSIIKSILLSDHS